MQALVTVLIALIVPTPDDAKAEQAKLKGTWAVVSAERDGKPNEDIKDDKLVFDGDKIVIKATREQNGTIKIDAGKKPKHIDLVPSDEEKKDRVLLAIYELNGDDLKICFARPGNPRPTEFSAAEGSGRTLVVLKREK